MSILPVFTYGTEEKNVNYGSLNTSGPKNDDVRRQLRVVSKEGAG